jgi:hypothetical protein
MKNIVVHGQISVKKHTKMILFAVNIKGSFNKMLWLNR